MTAVPDVLRIATRGSRLALWQADDVAAQLRRRFPQMQVERVIVNSAGDVNLTSPLREMGGEGVFTREVQHAVLDGRADLAVHSLKDLPTTLTPGLALAAVPERGPLFDALVAPQGQSIASIASLPPGAVIGTSSPRRQAQLLHLRPDLQSRDVRGNVETRLRKLDSGEYAALLLAVAGLSRLDFAHRVTLSLAPPAMYPAVSQGALGIECRSDQPAVIAAIEHLQDAWTRACVDAERSLLATLRAGCHAPLGVLTQRGASADQLHLEAVVLTRDGSTRLCAAASGSMHAARVLGETVAELLLRQGADAIVRPGDAPA